MEKNSSKLKGISILVLAVLIALTVLLLVNKGYFNKSGAVFSGKGFVLAGEISSMSNKNSTLYFMDEVMLEIQGQIIRAKGVGGNIAWSERLSGQVIKVTDTGENFVVVDNNKVLSCLSKKGKILWNYSLPYDCMELYSQKDGILLIEYKNTTGCRFDVLDKKGGKLGSGLLENAYLLDFSANETDMFSIAALDVSSDSVKTKVVTYNLKGDLVWANNFDNEVISSIAYGKNGNLLALGEHSIYKYRPNGKLAGKQELESGIERAALDGHVAVVITSDRGELAVSCYDANLRKLGSEVLEKVPDGIFISKDSFVLFDKDGFVQYDFKCNKVALYDSTVDILKMYITKEGEFYLVSNRKLQLLESR